MTPWRRYRDDDGIVHLQAPAWSRYGFWCRRTDTRGADEVDTSTPLTCVWCLTLRSVTFEDPIRDASPPPEWHR